MREACQMTNQHRRGFLDDLGRLAPALFLVKGASSEELVLTPAQIEPSSQSPTLVSFVPMEHSPDGERSQ